MPALRSHAFSLGAGLALMLLGAEAARADDSPGGPPASECDSIAAFHLLPTTAGEVHETPQTDWTHVAALCRAEVNAHPDNPQFVYDLGRAQAHLKNYQEAARDFRAAAGAGHVDALVELGVLAYTGHGVLQSYATAFDYFSKAMAAGSARAMANVAAMYGNGQGVPKDDVKSLDLAERAVEAGDAFALSDIATAYFNGAGVPRDYKMAAQYFQQLADLGDGRSMKFLANMYESGYLGPPDAAKASDLRLRAQRVDPDSQDPVPARLPAQHATASGPAAHPRRYVVFHRPSYGTSWSQGQPMVGGIFKAPAEGATCCPKVALICPGALPRCPG